MITLAAHRVNFLVRTAHHRVAQVYLRFAKHALEGRQLLLLLTLDRFRRANFLVEMAFRCQATLSTPERFLRVLSARLFPVLFLPRLRAKSVEVAPGAAPSFIVAERAIVE